MARPNVFTIPADAPFLEVLARAVLQGFPKSQQASPSPLDIARTTILVPSRRAARDLEHVFFKVCGKPAMLLPRIRPLGDIDEELFGFPDSQSVTDAEFPTAISPFGRELMLMDLIAEWARGNPQERLAREIDASPRQSISLAVSLAELVDSLETEGIEAARIAGLYGIEAARHREAILSFLSLIRERLPARMKEREQMSFAARRSLLLRREARRLAESGSSWPVIAAGSTGSIPAARELLAAIARLPIGAVILPGLDRMMDEESWREISPQHPQFMLKQFLTSLPLKREDVAFMAGCAPGARTQLAREIMRPPGTAEKWRELIFGQKDSLTQALTNVCPIVAQSVPDEASIISLILRKAFETPGKTASLVTSDRELARRVKRELANSGIDIDDSMGEPLNRIGAGAFLSLLLDVIKTGASPEKLLALFKHDFCRLGFEPEKARKAVAVMELAVLRAGFGAFPLAGLPQAVAQAQINAQADPHLHPAVRNLTAEDWSAAVAYAEQAASLLLPLLESRATSLKDHLGAVIGACERAADPVFWTGEEAEALHGLLADLVREEANLSSCNLVMAAEIVSRCMATTSYRRLAATGNRLTILGLLEARLASPDLVILGGLNEGRWPSPPDPGPWLNRPMREVLSMEQPERRIGQAAHDFVQALGCDEVYLTWCRRVGDAPSLPSRWVLRLQMLAAAAGPKDWLISGQMWRDLAASLNEPSGAAKPCARPKPAPPVEARPQRLSVTRVETLVRDPYALYARQILNLIPLEDLLSDPDMPERGSVFHRAIGDFLNAFPENLPSDPLDRLLRIGREHFTPLLTFPDVETFWWPQFERMARWFVREEFEQRKDTTRIFAEIDGALSVSVAGRAFRLTCRADRIDLLHDGNARVVDYKTGAVPTGRQVASGLSPQLTLEAAMLAEGAFAPIGKRDSREIAYVKVSGGDSPGEIIVPELERSVMECAREHLAKLISLLTAYADPRRSYLPRARMKKDDEEGEYDHFSRYREWNLAGSNP